VNKGLKPFVFGLQYAGQAAVKYGKLALLALHDTVRAVSPENVVFFRLTLRTTNQKRGRAVPKVMIVDDDRNTVKLLQTLLELDGFEVVVSPRGADVVPVAEQTSPDIFLMDYHLADMDGVDAVRQLRAHERFANAPIIMTSGLDVSDEAMEAGATTFLIKPFEPGDLSPLFNKLLAG
jgi:CheY-like chemotaxis protein